MNRTIKKMIVGFLTGFLGSIFFLFFLYTLAGGNDYTFMEILRENKLYIWLCTTASILLMIIFAE